MLKNSPRSWGERKFELLVALTYETGKSLGYDHIDKATLRDNVYVPQGYEDTEEQFRQMRAALLQVMRGERPIPATIVGPIQVDQPLPEILPQPPALLHRNET